MITDADIKYALMAANSYAVKRDVTSISNEISVPGWTILGQDGRNDSSGFTARAYQNGNQIVIAYTGTTFESVGNDIGDWFKGNIPAGVGATLAPQVVDAARFYLDILKAHPDADISFTGHSLGGGLASLMSVFFNEPATVFDEAPFERSADSLLVVSELKVELHRENYDLSTPAPAFDACSAENDKEWRLAA